jgi:hypothetical protein
MLQSSGSHGGFCGQKAEYPRTEEKLCEYEKWQFAQKSVIMRIHNSMKNRH